MELSKTQKTILGIFTLVPFVFFPVILWKVFQFVLEMIALGEREPDASAIVVAVFSFIFPIAVLSMLSIALLIFYIIHAVSNKKLERIEQLMWVLLFVFFGIIAFPVYWLVRIRNSDGNP